MNTRNRFSSYRLLVLPVLALVALGCRQQAARPIPSPVPETSSDELRFRRVTEASGVTFQHENGETGRKYFPEWMGGGCALFDYDGDGNLDLFLVNGGPLPGWQGKEPPRNRLYRSNGDATFTDVTLPAGLRTLQYGIGCCSGDFNGDGHPDLYVTGFNGNVLYQNNGDGTFADVTRRAGVAPDGLCSGCAFGDYDGDGWQDLYVCRYVHYDIQHNQPCYQVDGLERRLTMCRQVVYPAAPHVLYRNNRDGTFSDVSQSSGIKVTPGRGLGVLFTDLKADGRQDIYVANDLTPNFLFRGGGAGRLREDALERGVALSAAGAVQAGMGVAAGDVNRDGLLDLIVTNFSGEYTTYYRQRSDHQFEDVSAASGLIEPTHRLVGFGVGLEDFDHDGWPDLFLANGHVSEDPELSYEDRSLAQPKLVLRNREGRFEAVREPWADTVTGALRVGRGAAFGDLDNDGDVDVVVNNLHAPPDVLLNETSTRNHWLKLDLRGTGRDRLAIGARITLWTGNRSQTREVRTGTSYLSQNDLGQVFGLGEATVADRIEVMWPDRSRERWLAVTGGRKVRLIQGSGKPASSTGAR